MRTRSIRAVTARAASGVLLALTACSDQVTAPRVTPDALSSGYGGSRAAFVAQHEASALQVARALAMGLAGSSSREALRDAMRSSRVTEHKLVLQEYARSVSGRAVLEAAALSSGTSRASLEAAVQALPPMDLYLSFEQHRRTWRGTDDLLVASVFDPDAPSVTAYDVLGHETVLRRADGVPGKTLIMLHPAERKAVRDNLPPNSPGVVIQDANELNTWSAILANNPLPIGARQTIGLGAESSSSSALAASIYINHFNIQEGDGWFGHSEMEFHSFAVVLPISAWVGDYVQFPVFQASCFIGSYFRGGVVEDLGYNGLFLLSPGVGSVAGLSCGGASAVYGIRIIEDDGLVTGNNDEFGWRFFVPGAYPHGATINMVGSFFKNTWQTWTRTAYLRIQSR